MTKNDKVIKQLEELINKLKDDSINEEEMYKVYREIGKITKNECSSITNNQDNKKYLDDAARIMRLDMLEHIHDYAVSKIGKDNVGDIYYGSNSKNKNIDGYLGIFSIYLKDYNINVMDIYLGYNGLYCKRRDVRFNNMRNLGINLTRVRKKIVNEVLELDSKSIITKEQYNKFLDIRENNKNYLEPFAGAINKSIDDISSDINRWIYNNAY